MKRFALKFAHYVVGLSVLALASCGGDGSKQPFQFVYTSDLHYGITRATFQGSANVDASVVNTAMVSKINALPKVNFPCDKGVNECATIGSFDFLVEAGDIANRSENGAQSAAASWNQFAADYTQRLSITNAAGQPAKLYLLPGNHDVSDAIGFYRTLSPLIDATSMVEIYNRMLSPAVPKTNATYNYANDKINYSRDINGVHFAFINIWPESGVRAWLENDLKNVHDTTPVVIFAHDPPEVDARHFTNPNGAHDINATDKFENLLADQLADLDAQGNKSTNASTTIEQRALASFMKAHRNVVAYFHGHDNYNEYYVWKGPDSDIQLNVFRVDSPMKGELSAADETKLSFQVVAVDPAARKMTVREYRWNVDSTKSWGDAITVSLQPR